MNSQITATVEPETPKAVRSTDLVRRFVVQECDPRHEAYGWYDDPSCDECETLESAKHHLESDTECEGHARLYRHRIIERTERVAYSPNDQAETQT